MGEGEVLEAFLLRHHDNIISIILGNGIET